MNNKVIYAYNGILFTLKKEGNLKYGITGMKLEDIRPSKNKPVTEGQILNDSTYIRYRKVKLIV